MLGEPDLRALDDLYARLVWIPDGELERLDDAAREYRRIVGEPDPPPTHGGAGEAAGSGEGGGGADPEAKATGPTPHDGPGAESLADALEQAIATARADQLEQLDQDVDLEQVTPRRRRGAAVSPATADAAAAPGCRPGGCPTAASTGRRTPTRCSTPAATPTGCARRSRREPGRSTSAPPAGASTAAPTPAAGRSRPPAGRSPAIRGGSRGRCGRRSRSRTSG